MTGQTFEAKSVWLRWAIVACALAAFAAYVAVGTLATLFAPPVLIIFVAPLAIIAIAAAPAGRAAPKSLVMPLLLAGAVMMPLWPTYIHLKLGPMPIITPPRIFLYAVTAIWIYDIVFSPIRRGHFFYAIKKQPLIGGAVLFLFLLNFLSLPMAQGRSLAAQEFIRQVIIWLIPFCAFATYFRRPRELRQLLVAVVIGAAGAGLVAVGELASGKLVANLLSPFISGEAAWLRITQEMKIRDGVFRAQATHTHPLSLGEFLAFCAPIALAFAVAARSRVRWWWLAALAAILLGILATNSRGALVGLVAGLSLTSAYIYFRFLKTAAATRFRPAIGLAVVAMAAASPIFAAGGHKLITGDAGTSAARSSQSRIDQIEMAWPKIVKRPVLGYGTGRSARIIGYWGRTLSVDNYYLSLTVDLGFPGPVAFLVAIGFGLRASLKGAKYASYTDRWMLIGFAGALAAFAVSRSIISQTGNLSFFYLVFGAYTGVAAGVAGRRRTASSRASVTV